MKKIMVVFGTRPEAIKMCPVVKELRRHEDFQIVCCVTGQHRQMLDQVMTAFDIRADYDLNIMKDGQTLFDVTASVLLGMRAVLQKEQPDLVLVHGDTTTTFSAALAAFYLGIPVGHVEAGLRTYDLASPFPEEFNRQGVGVLARFHFAPTETAKNNLLREGKDSSSVFVTGNTVIDALETTVKETYDHPVLDWAADSRMILLTTHRRENLGAPLVHMFQGIRDVVEQVEDVKVVYPIHLNPVVRDTARKVFAGCDRIRLIEPLDVLDFHNFMNRAYLILTDSGGIQEEAPALGKPVLVMRETTERPEGVAAGTLKLVGTDRQTIYRASMRLLTDPAAYQRMSNAVNPYGDGKACQRIAEILKREL